VESEPETTDADLLLDSLGDPERFAGFFDRHARSVHRYVASRVRRDDIDDLVSETFITAFRIRAQYERTYDDARPWLFGIATNVIRHHHRSERRRLTRLRSAFHASESQLASSDSVVATVDGAMASDRIGRALAQLSERDQEVLVLAAGSGLTYDQIAMALDVPVGTVRSRLSRGRQRPIPSRRSRRASRMIDELELIRRHVGATVDSEADLDPIRQRVVAAIREDGGADRMGRRRAVGVSRAPNRRRATVLISGLAAAGVAAAVVAFLVVAPPSARQTPKATEAFPVHLSPGDQLRLIADRVADQPIPRPGSGQALSTQSTLSLVATVNNGAAQATIELSVQKLSTASGQTCTTLSAQPAQFASPAEQAAWNNLHLLATPNPPTASACLQSGDGATPPDAITGAGQLIDVSSLATDPSTLEQELENGTTGIAALDQLLPDQAAPNPGFQRAAMLLIGPTIGATEQFDAALYRAIALLPGVASLGSTTTHEGQTGQGYASGPGASQSTIVVNPSTGQLLEVRGLDDSDSLTSLATHYLGSGPMLVNAYSTQLQWLDPDGSPSVVELSNLPAGVPVFVFATTMTGVTYNETLSSVQALVEPYTKDLQSSGFQATHPTGSPSVAALQWSFQWSFAGPGPVVNEFLESLRGSGLFLTVSEL
jgi:RNA polymerase sigma factor (sigma-70 family)